MNTPPKKVKAYGFIPFTKKQYIITQLSVFAAILALVFWAIFGDLNKLLFGYGNVLLAAVIIGEVAETVMMLRAFDTKK